MGNEHSLNRILSVRMDFLLSIDCAEFGSLVGARLENRSTDCGGQRCPSLQSSLQCSPLSERESFPSERKRASERQWAVRYNFVLRTMHAARDPTCTYSLFNSRLAACYRGCTYLCSLSAWVLDAAYFRPLRKEWLPGYLVPVSVCFRI